MSGTNGSKSAGNSDYDGYLTVGVQAAKAAGAIIKAAFKQPKNVEHKGAVDLVTETDKQSEALILEHIQRAFPSHKFIGEEGSAAQGFTDELTDDPTWMCDPLDGTTNFVHAFPFVCVSIALVIKKQAVAAVVFNPILDELFTATLGGGAHLNGEPIRCSSTSDLGHALMVTEFGTARDDATFDAIFDRMRSLASASRSVRCCGSCALNLCSVAMGRTDVFYEIGFGGCWDVAAGALVVAEAGGRVMDPAGGPFNVMGRRVLATNSHLGKAASDILAGCKTSPKEPAPSRA